MKCKKCGYFEDKNHCSNCGYLFDDGIQGIDSKSSSMWDIWIKAFIIAGLFIGKRVIKRWHKRRGHSLIYRCERVIFYMDKAGKKFPNPLTRSYIHQFAYIFASFLDMDNAYFQWFNEFLEGYYSEFKKSKK